jgi:hypothetical protein
MARQCCRAFFRFPFSVEADWQEEKEGLKKNTYEAFS